MSTMSCVLTGSGKKSMKGLTWRLWTSGFHRCFGTQCGKRPHWAFWEEPTKEIHMSKPFWRYSPIFQIVAAHWLNIGWKLMSYSKVLLTAWKNQALRLNKGMRIDLIGRNFAGTIIGISWQKTKFRPITKYSRNLYSKRYVSFDTKTKIGIPAFHFSLSLSI